MSPTIIRRNERSWGIELISQINSIANRCNLLIKKAGGETTISIKKGNSMFPDVILYGDTNLSTILQGWELKMPDVSITDAAFVEDAQRKAKALNLNSCVIWNFTYAKFYIYDDETGQFHVLKQWDNSHIRTRNDVETYRADWLRTLEEVVLDVNEYLTTNRIKGSNTSEIISKNAIVTLVNENKSLTADLLRDKANTDVVMEAFIDDWWQNTKNEYELDETDKYVAYAKVLIINWTNKIIFAHILKRKHNDALIINNLEFSTTTTDAIELFNRITEKCDFFNIFSEIDYNQYIPQITWDALIYFSLFIKENGLSEIEQNTLQAILEGTINTVRREINGQFPTPVELAKILARITIHDWRGDTLDCCCGTGTIASEIQKAKIEHLDLETAINTTWASDKYTLPLQIANISLSNIENINLPNRIFQSNILTLNSGDTINITNPQNGELVSIEIPKFSSIISNLPFVGFETIPEDDKIYIKSENYDISERADLYCYITLRLKKILRENGYLGIITSNSWLGTTVGDAFYRELEREYNILQVHISGKGRWFNNANVVTTILILQAKSESQNNVSSSFFIWKKSLDEIEQNESFERAIINSSLLNRCTNSEVVNISTYSSELIHELKLLNISYNALFHNILWLLEIREYIVQINTVFNIFRGSRRGKDEMFYPNPDEHRIEPEYLKKVLINAREVNFLDAEANSDAFCCGDTIETLQETGKSGALEWISRFENQTTKRKGVETPLPIVLARRGMQWYEMKENEIAEIFTMMNPDNRLFFSRFIEPSFINQRLIGLTSKQQYRDIDLNHALLNSIFTMFYIEASGFGRGLGVLDINSNNIAQCMMLNPSLVSENDRKQILDCFKKLKARQIFQTVEEELQDPVRLEFDMTVLRAFGIDSYYENIVNSLKSLRQVRKSVQYR